MELMQIIQVFLLIFFFITVSGLAISFLLYKMKKKNNVNEVQEESNTDFSILKPQQAFPGRLEMHNPHLLLKYKKEQERFNNIRSKGTRPVIYNKLPQKYKVINDKYSESTKQQAFFRLNYSNPEQVIEHYNIINANASNRYNL